MTMRTVQNLVIKLWAPKWASMSCHQKKLLHKDRNMTENTPWLGVSICLPFICWRYEMLVNTRSPWTEWLEYYDVEWNRYNTKVRKYKYKCTYGLIISGILIHRSEIDKNHLKQTKNIYLNTVLIPKYYFLCLSLWNATWEAVPATKPQFLVTTNKLRL